MQQQVYGTLFKNINELKKQLAKSEAEHSTLISTNGECLSLPVFAQMADISNIYCQQLHN